MSLRKYNNNLFEEISKTLVLEFDKETNQYSLINNNTPGIFGLGDTKEEAVEEYLSALKDYLEKEQDKYTKKMLNKDFGVTGIISDLKSVLGKKDISSDLSFIGYHDMIEHHKIKYNEVEKIDKSTLLNI